MVTTETWKDNKILQCKFENSLIKIAQSNHRLSKNYSSGFLRDEIIAYSMSYDNDQVYLCSTIGTKKTWPVGVYRLINRVFKPNPTGDFTKNIQSFWVDMIHQQLEICKQQQDFQTAIITRQAGYRNTLNQLKLHINTPDNKFHLLERPVWVLENFSNPECYQDVLFYGNQIPLKNFKSDPCIVQ
jgi:hypothetical protein